MKNTFIALVLFSTFAMAAPPDTALCARIGLQTTSVAGQARREVRFQLCTPDGQPLNRVVNLEMLVIQPGGNFSSQSVSTDPQGRFSFTYGGSVTLGGPVSRELHSFTLDGQVIASFILRRSPQGIEFMRAPDSLDGEGEGRQLSVLHFQSAESKWPQP